MIDIDFLKTGYEWSSTDMEGLIYTIPTNLQNSTGFSLSDLVSNGNLIA